MNSWDVNLCEMYVIITVNLDFPFLITYTMNSWDVNLCEMYVIIAVNLDFPFPITYA